MENYIKTDQHLHCLCQVITKANRSFVPKKTHDSHTNLYFDTGIYVVTDNGMGIGFGLAMEDSLLNDPYFYMSGYATKSSVTYENLPDLPYGKWIITENWKGATFPLSDLASIPEQNRIDALGQFMLNSVAWFVKQDF